MLIVCSVMLASCDRWILDRYRIEPFHDQTLFAISPIAEAFQIVEQQAVRFDYSVMPCSWKIGNSNLQCVAYYGEYELCGLVCGKNKFSFAISNQSGASELSLRFYHGLTLWRHDGALEVQDAILNALAIRFGKDAVKKAPDVGTGPNSGTSSEWWLSIE